MKEAQVLIAETRYFLLISRAEMNMKFRVRIRSLNGKTSKYPNSLNKPIYYKNSWFMLEIHKIYFMQVPKYLLIGS